MILFIGAVLFHEHSVSSWLCWGLLWFWNRRLQSTQIVDEGWVLAETYHRFVLASIDMFAIVSEVRFANRAVSFEDFISSLALGRNIKRTPFSLLLEVGLPLFSRIWRVLIKQPSLVDEMGWSFGHFQLWKISADNLSAKAYLAVELGVVFTSDAELMAIVSFALEVFHLIHHILICLFLYYKIIKSIAKCQRRNPSTYGYFGII